jgi:hypothetical protein
MSVGGENEIREYVYKGGGYFWAKTSNVPGLCGTCTKDTSTLIQEHPKEPWKYACPFHMPSQNPVPMQAVIRTGWLDSGRKLSSKRQRAFASSFI